MIAPTFLTVNTKKLDLKPLSENDKNQYHSTSIKIKKKKLGYLSHHFHITISSNYIKNSVNTHHNIYRILQIHC